ncbi:hypothetical protein MSSAC_2759 [Methanosarcina siciliae C2J]|uniref:Uncharacterized protein n=1 Tax=Methanosarcina siciliae C2J TaxID=1434118 RepID=A0A0E3PME6_9EURY|nr:hypothetical protein [Methanosarcina siciliae]AKB35628.1 hypothetical protein MSSAC_1038 [Methanosarcina siciliae C2J]AKB37349.1 hypothetical protein MSSAC_2759 [Methanosarcina siciliae C2J]
MIYPHFFWDPHSGAFVVVDTIQQLSRTHTSSSQRYTQSSTGHRKQVTAKDLPSGSFEATFYNTSLTIERYLEYITGKVVLFVYGPRDLASYITIQNNQVVHASGNTLKATFDMTFQGPVRGHFRDVSDSRCSGSGAAITRDTQSVLNAAAKLSAQNDVIWFSEQQNVVKLPSGDYRLFARVKDTAQVSSDVRLAVYADGTSIATTTKTAAAYYRILLLDFTIGAAHNNKTIYFQVRKNSTAANNIYVDFLGCVAVP